MKTYHELMRDFAMQRVENEENAMWRINIAVIHGWGAGAKGLHVRSAQRHYDRCRERMHCAMMSAAYHGYVIESDRRTGR